MKQRRFAKVLSWILAALLVISLLPSSMLQARAEEGEATAHAWEWTRLAGKNRYQTATLATQEVYEEGSCAEIIIASGQAFPDALSGSALAGALGCPILLTNKTKLSPDTKTELQRIAAQGCTVYILGGNGAVSADVEAEINELDIVGLTTERVKGSNREATAKAVFEKGGFPEGCTIIVATGYAYADVLSISPYAYAAKAPVILAKKDGSLSDETKTLISKTIKPGKAIVIGGSKAVSADTEDYLKEIAGKDNVMRLSGKNRYITSAEIMKWELGLKTDAPFQPEVEMHADGMGVATGTNFADALGATSLLGKIASPLLLVADNNATNAAATEENINQLVAPFAADMTHGYIFGGRGAVSEQIQGWLNAVVPEVDEKIYTVDEIREVMKDFTDRQVSDKEYTVRGVVTSSSYKSNYNSYTVWLQSDDGTTARAFELYSVGMDESITDDYTASNALVGKIVTCKGYLQLYGTTYEMPFLNASLSPTGEAYTPNIIKVEDGEAPPEPGEDLVEDKEYTVDGVLAAMVNYIEGQTSAVECTVTGVATSSSYKEKYSSYDIWLQSDDGTNPQAFQLYSVALDASIEGDYTAADALAGKTVTCRGYVKVYDGKYEMPYLGADSSPTGEAYTPLVTKVEGGEQPPEVTDQDKVDYEAGKLSLQTLYTQETVVTLPTPDKYEDVQIVWASDSEFAVIDQEAGTMTITLPEEGEVTANVTATLSLGTATPAEQAFVLTIRNPGDEEVLTVDEILAIMADYTSGQISEVEYVVRGVVTSSSYKSNYNSYTIWLQNNDGTTAKAFELYSVGLDESITDDYTASNALVGKIVTCRGYVQLYNTTYEMPFLNASLSPTGEAYTPTVILVEDGEAPPEPGEDLVEDKEYTVDGVLAAMANYIEGQTSAVECTVTGVATSSSYNSKYSSYTIWLQNDDGSVAEAFQLYSVTLADGIEGDYTAENALAGKTVTCRGYVKVYDGKYEMPYLGAESSPTGEAYTPVVTNVTGGEEPPVFEDLVEDKEYTVDELLAAMANYPADQVSGVECTVTGVASSSSYRSNYNSYNIWLKSDDGETNKAFYLYSVAIDESIEGDFTESNALAGKVVTCRGYVKYYNGDYEMPYLGADSSPTGEAYTPVVSKIEDGEEPPVFEDLVEDKEYTVDELLAAMANYPDGYVSAVECTVTGVATASTYNSRYSSYNVDLQNDDGSVEKAFVLYSAQLSADITGDYTAANAFAGKTVTCRGYVKLYGDTYEMAYISATESSPLITKVEGGEEPPVFEDHVEDKEYTVDELLEAMSNYPDGQVSAVECTVTGVASSSSYNSRYSSYTVWLKSNDGTVEQAFELYSAQLGEGIEGDWTADDAFKDCTVTCRGYVKLYGEVYEMAYISATQSSPVISSIVEPERTPQEKVDYEKEHLTLQEVYTEAGVVELPKPQKYDEVDISWGSACDNAFIDDDAKTMTITLPEGEDVTGQIVATLSLGTTEAYAQVIFNITIKAPLTGGIVWTKVAFADIQDGDLIAITATYQGTTWAMSTTEVSSRSCPMGVVVELSGNTFATEEIEGYGFTAGTVGNNRSFLVYESDKYLYCTNANDGVRIGSPQNAETVAFTIDQDYLYNVAQSRYLGVYRTNPDWRCYATIGSNIANETIEFWKGEAGAEPELTEQEKVDYEANALTLPDVVTEAGTITLPTPSKYDEVQIAWASDSDYAVLDTTAGTLTFTLPETEDVTANVTATLSLGGASVPKNFAILIKVPAPVPEDVTWTKVAWDDIADGDVIAITAAFEGTTWVLSTVEAGSNSQPLGVVVEPADNAFTTQGAAGYGFTAGTVEGGRSFLVYDTEGRYLFCVADNNGVRLGNSEEIAFTLVDGYLYHVGQARYLGVYRRNVDWRCYTSINTNIAGEVIEFWKADLGGEQPPVGPTDQEKVDEEKEALELQEEPLGELVFAEDAEITLPGPKTYPEVQIAWESDAKNVVVDDGKLVITQIEEEVIANVTATLTLNEASAEKTFVITVKAKPGDEPETAVWTKVAWADITEADTIAITMTKTGTYAGTYILTSTVLDSGAPSAAETVTPADNKFETEDDAKYGWSIVPTEGGYFFKCGDDPDKYLYMINNNNGVRIGTLEAAGTGAVFVLDESNYLKSVAQTRFLGVYNAQDWRSYTSPTSTNIANQVLEFWKFGEGGDEPPVEPTDQEKVDYELANMTVQDLFEEETTITLPTVQTYTEVELVQWSADPLGYITFLAGPRMTVTPPAEGTVTVNLTVELKLNEATGSRTFTLTLKGAETPIGGTEKTVEIVAANLGYANQEDVTTVTAEGVTVTFDKASGSNAPKYYTSGEAIRTYVNNTFTFAVKEGAVIKSIKINFVSSGYTGSCTCNGGEYTVTDAAGEWAGEAGSVMFTVTNGQARIVSIEVTYVE